MNKYEITFMVFGEGRLSLEAENKADVQEIFKALKSNELLLLVDSFNCSIIDTEEIKK